MKKYFFLILTLCLFSATFSFGQSYKYIYYFDGQLNQATAKKSTIIAKGFIEKDGLLKLDYFSKLDNFLFMSAHYLDSSLNRMEGAFTEFSINGNIKKQGNFIKDQKEGSWQTWDTSGFRTDSAFYKNDRRLFSATYGYFKNGQLSYVSFTDSVADTLKTISYNEKKEAVSEVFFKGNKGISKKFNAGSILIDTLNTREEREAEFNGGIIEWQHYLMTHLDPSTPVNRGAPKGQYQVFVKFRVSKEGKISDVVAETNFGYGMEKEVIRIIKTGPDWIPASQYGRKVNAYRRQPVTFSVEEK